MIAHRNPAARTTQAGRLWRTASAAGAGLAARGRRKLSASSAVAARTQVPVSRSHHVRYCSAWVPAWLLSVPLAPGLDKAWPLAEAGTVLLACCPPFLC